jgi:DNA-binding CsgD family transcriptional regulator
MPFKTELVDLQDLTPREGEVLQLVCSARSNKAISRELAISINTTIHHIDNIRKKLDVEQTELNARLAVLRVALARGIVRIGCVFILVGVASQVDDPVTKTRGRFMRPSMARRVEWFRS